LCTPTQALTIKKFVNHSVTKTKAKQQKNKNEKKNPQPNNVKDCERLVLPHIILIIPLIKWYDLRWLPLASLAKNNIHKSSERSTVACWYIPRDSFDNYKNVTSFLSRFYSGFIIITIIIS